MPGESTKSSLSRLHRPRTQPKHDDAQHTPLLLQEATRQRYQCTGQRFSPHTRENLSPTCGKEFRILIKTMIGLEL